MGRIGRNILRTEEGNGGGGIGLEKSAIAADISFISTFSSVRQFSVVVCMDRCTPPDGFVGLKV